MEKMRKKILVIDDEPGIREIFRCALDQEAYQLVLAEDGEKGVKLYESEKPDFVFLDLKLPGIDGIGVLEKIRDKDKEIPVVIITGHGTMELASRAMKAGAYDYIQKPFDLEKITRLMKRIFEMQGLKEELQMLRQKVKALQEEEKEEEAD